MIPRRLTLAAAAALLAACADLDYTTAVNTIDVAIADPSWRYDIAPVLSETCATSGACHKGSNAANGLNLELAQSYQSVVNVPSLAFPQLMRVRPGQPDSSFLYLATSSVPAERLNYYRMPLSEYPLPAPVRETIRNWILDGAPDN